MENTSQIVEQNSPVPVATELTEVELFTSDPLLSAIGIAKELWADEHADEYVARLRKDW
jgi:hypothetical protein